MFNGTWNLTSDTFTLRHDIFTLRSSHWDLTLNPYWTHTVGAMALLARHSLSISLLNKKPWGALHIPNIVSMYTSSFIHLSFLFFYLTETVPGGASLPYGSVSTCCAVCKALHGIGFTVTTNPPKCAIFKTITKRVFNASSGHLSGSLPVIPDGVCHLLNGITGNTTLVG